MLTMLMAMCVLVIYLRWAVQDANRRQKNPLFVAIAVVFFFPFGLIAWLLFRPPHPTD